MVIGRDRCYDIFRSNGLCQRTSRKRPKTTNSNHNYYIYPDLLNVAPKFVATRLGAMVVADITYVNTGQGWAYLSLLTDASSRAIVGYALYKTLETEGPLKALEMAISFYEKYHIDMSTLIHHSDRGVQYCSNKYVERLKEHQINILKRLSIFHITFDGRLAVGEIIIGEVSDKTACKGRKIIETGASVTGKNLAEIAGRAIRLDLEIANLHLAVNASDLHFGIKSKEGIPSPGFICLR